MNLVSLFLLAFLTENVVLTKFLGICPFVGTSSREKSALGMGMAVCGVMTLSSILTYLIYHFLLIPTDTEYLMTIMFILVIACMVQMLSILMKRFFPAFYRSLGIYLPLITTNCAVLGVTLLNIASGFHFLEMLVFSIGSSLGFTFVIYVFASVRERILKSPIPKSFEGYPIAFITAAIMVMLFARFR